MSRVLIVDHDAVLRGAMARQLASSGLHVDEAPTARSAMEQALHTRYDVVISDLAMPESGGMALIERLSRQQPKTSFVLLTGEPDVDLSAAGRAYGLIAAVLHKPLDPDELLEAITQATALRQVAGPMSINPSALELPVLLVEDNPGDALLVIELIHEIAGHDNPVHHVTRLADAIAALHSSAYLAVLTDLTLPDACGVDAVRRIRVASPTTPIVVLSSREDDALVLSSIKLGAQDYLLKREVSSSMIRRAIRFAAERKRTEVELAQQAYSDPLTHLSNRLAFDARLDQAVRRCARTREPFAVGFLDLDHFKAINDQQGHDAGDRVLTTVAERLRRALRECDTVARLGGDEFAILLDQLTGIDEMRPIVRRIMHALTQPPEGDAAGVVVTASVGIVCVSDGSYEPGALLRFADTAMYEAKRNGRNTVVIEHAEVIARRLDVAAH